MSQMSPNLHSVPAPVVGRQRRSAVRYTNLEKAASSPILTKPNRQVTFDPSLVISTPLPLTGVVGAMQGWRKTMEDRHALFSTNRNASESGGEEQEPVALVAVFDGHRGVDAAAFTSVCVPNAIVELLKEHPTDDSVLLGDELHRKFVEVDAALRRTWEEQSLRSSRAGSEANTLGCDNTSMSGDYGQSTSNPTSGQSSPQDLSFSINRPPPSLGDAAPITGTTAVIAVVTAHHYTFINVGDSRSYLVTRRNVPEGDDLASTTTSDTTAADDAAPKVRLPAGLKTQATSTDHRANCAQEAARIEAAGGCIVNGRVNGKLLVSRAFGDFDLKPNILDCTVNPVVCIPEVVQLPRYHLVESSKKRRGTSQFDSSEHAESQSCSSTLETASSEEVFEYDMLVVGCDGVWELQSIDSIAVWIDQRLQAMAPILNGSNPEDVEQCAQRVEALLKDAISDVLVKCCAGTCDQHGTTPGADNMSLGVLVVRH